MGVVCAVCGRVVTHLVAHMHLVHPDLIGAVPTQKAPPAGGFVLDLEDFAPSHGVPVIRLGAEHLRRQYDIGYWPGKRLRRKVMAKTPALAYHARQRKLVRHQGVLAKRFYLRYARITLSTEARFTRYVLRQKKRHILRVLFTAADLWERRTYRVKVQRRLDAARALWEATRWHEQPRQAVPSGLAARIESALWGT